MKNKEDKEIINTYSKSGVNIGEIKKNQRKIGDLISLTHSFQKLGRVISGFGHYAGLIELDENVIAMHTDGVGTKVIIAQIMQKYDTVGIDCIAMNANDIICVGAKPFAFVDYIALKKPDSKIIKNLVKGLIKGAKMANVSIVGGETAIVPDILAENENTFDLAGTMIGLTKKADLVLGNKIQHDDVIIGLESNGLHSNGYSLVRKVLLTKYNLDYKPSCLEYRLGEELLKPTTIYAKPMLKLIEKKTKIHGLANITGGSFSKLSRLNSNVSFNLKNFPKPQNIFKFIKEEGKIDLVEMYRTFNMGIGFCVILSKESMESSIDIIEKFNIKTHVLGHVDNSNKGQVIAHLDNKNCIL